jgi:hypothetical protein
VSSREPSFLVAGAQKSGTGWLVDQLSGHPDVWMPRGEVRFFVEEERFRRGMQWYLDHFRDAPPNSVLGEKSPGYMWNPEYDVQGRIRHPLQAIVAALPSVRLIVLLRDPVRRAVSALNHHVQHGRLSPSDDLDRRLLRDGSDPLGLVDRGYYDRQVKALWSACGEARVHVMIFEEDVIASPRTGLQGAARFLGLSSSFDFPERNENRKAKGRRLSVPALALARGVPALRGVARRFDPFEPYIWKPEESTVAALREKFAPSVAALEGMLGRELPWESSRSSGASGRNR